MAGIPEDEMELDYGFQLRPVGNTEITSNVTLHFHLDAMVTLLLLGREE